MQDKLRIGVLLNDSFHPHGGGGYGYYEALVNAIDEYHFHPLLEFVFLNLNENQNVPFKKETIGFPFVESIGDLRQKVERVNKIPFRLIRGLLRKIKGLPASIESTGMLNQKLEEWMTKNKIDLIYFPMAYQEIGGLNFPFVATHWDIGHYSSYAMPELSMNHTFESREYHYNHIHRKALAIFCESDAGKDELVKYKQINPNRIFKVPLFPSGLVKMEIEAEETVRIITNQFALEKRNYFVYPAQFWSHKNHYHLLLAMKKVVGKYPGLKLVLPGSDKGNLDYIKNVIAHLGIESNVLIPGFISNEALYSLYKNAVALVMPTLLGPTNMPLLEAACLGCAVITSDFQGHREMLGDYATYVDPLNEDAISQAMISEYESGNLMAKTFTNQINTIDSAVRQIEQNFMQIRKVRKTFGSNFLQF